MCGASAPGGRRCDEPAIASYRRDTLQDVLNCLTYSDPAPKDRTIGSLP